jgi:NAD(P)H-dependent FMN reductase
MRWELTKTECFTGMAGPFKCAKLSACEVGLLLRLRTLEVEERGTRALQKDSEGSLSPMRILAISGSLRARSTNTLLLQAAMELASPDMRMVLYSGLGSLPHFNPDLDPDLDQKLENTVLPEACRELRREVGISDGLLISSPEYAHGIAGSMKNALDWLVGSTEFPGKPVAVLNASPRASHADLQLREILKTMAAQLVEQASIVVPIQGTNLDLPGILSDPALSALLRNALTHLRDAIREGASAEA